MKFPAPQDSSGEQLGAQCLSSAPCGGNWSHLNRALPPLPEAQARIQMTPRNHSPTSTPRFLRGGYSVERVLVQALEGYDLGKASFTLKRRLGPHWEAAPSLSQTGATV